MVSRSEPNAKFRIARYSWNDDYHDIIEEKLKDLDLAMQDLAALLDPLVVAGGDHLVAQHQRRADGNTAFLITFARLGQSLLHEGIWVGHSYFI